MQIFIKYRIQKWDKIAKGGLFAINSLFIYIEIQILTKIEVIKT